MKLRFSTALPGALLGVLAVALSTACRTTQVERRAAPVQPVVRHLAPVRAWDVTAREGVVGRVVQFTSAEDSVYMVQNPWNQDLGMIDQLGRAWRYRPHEREPAWVGSGTILEGAQTILGVEGCRLEEILPTASSGGPDAS
ncbi:MAG: hypothetical protein O7B99_08485 [Planctomycetota bacterium]|nr:hypothetical protein [Planctomycetota bacterium]